MARCLQLVQATPPTFANVPRSNSDGTPPGQSMRGTPGEHSTLLGGHSAAGPRPGASRSAVLPAWWPGHDRQLHAPVAAALAGWGLQRCGPADGLS